MTWANQIRILKQQFEALGAIIGQNFIYALKPVVTALNTVMAKLIQFARVVSNSLGKIFGWKYEDTTGGIADDLEFGADAADDLGSGLGGAADKAKKLKQQLQGFDELNVLASNTPSSGGGGGALGNTDVSATGGQWVRDNTEKFFESDLDSLYKLGDYIGTTLTNQLRSIDWNKVYEGARNFGSGLASFLNGLISPELFSATGATIAGALNTAIYSTLSFGQTFDFEEFGLSIAEGINTFFRDTDFSALGQDIKTWVNGLKTTLITIIKEIEWGEILRGIGDVLKSLDAETIATLFGFGALSMVFKRGLFSTLGTALGAVTTLPAVLTTGLNGIGAKIKIGFVGGLGAAFGGFKLGEWIYENITGDDTSDINYLDYFLGDGKASAEEWWGAVKEYIKNDIISFGDEGSSNTGIALWDNANKWGKENRDTLAGGLFGALAKKTNSNTKSISEGIKGIATDSKKYFPQAEQSAKKYKKSFTDESKKLVDESIPLYSGMFNNIVQLAEGVNESGSDSFQKLKNVGAGALSSLSQNTTSTTQSIVSTIISKFSSASSGASESITKIASAFATASGNMLGVNASTTSSITSGYSSMSNAVQSITNAMKNVVNNNSNSIKITSTDTTSDIVAKYKAMRSSVVGESDAMKNSINNNSNSIKITSADTTSDIVAKYKAMRSSNTSEVGLFATSTVSTLGKMKKDSLTETDGLGAGVKAQFESARLGANASVTSLLSSVTSGLSTTKNKIQNESWYTPGLNLVAGLANGISTKWNSQSGDGLVGKIVALAKGLTAALKRAFGIHSPSREWATVGHYLTRGLEIGTLSEEGHLNKSIIAMGTRLTDNFSSSLTLATPSSLSSNYDFGVTSAMAHSFSADTSMTSNIADGVRQGLSASQAEQNALLREQNELLYQLLQKETISSDDVYNVVVNKNRDTFNRTGFNPLFA